MFVDTAVKRMKQRSAAFLTSGNNFLTKVAVLHKSRGQGAEGSEVVFVADSVVILVGHEECSSSLHLPPPPPPLKAER